MEKRTANIKEEECEWESVHPKQESLCIKEEEEDCVWESKAIKDKSEQQMVGISLGEHESAGNIKEEDNLHSESIFLHVCQEETKTGLLSSPSRPCAFLECSVIVKPEPFACNIKRTEELLSRKTMENQPSSAGYSEENLQDSGSFSPCSSDLSSLQCRLTHIQQNENSNKLTSELEMCIPTSFQPVVELPRADTVNTHHLMQNTNSAALNISKEQDKSVKCKPKCKDNQLSQTTEKPYCCSQCGQQFSQMRYLQKHKIIHTGEKPYCCSACGKRFSQMDCLQIHTRIHTGEKPYTCSECSKRFSHISNLRKHEKFTQERSHTVVLNVVNDSPK
uniref:C2H2-type domain-containing protein n=1 Tax=Erpetoichthys calabaricus TaxID=27687 RepID=A0A8C4RNK6_ERPCA